MPALGEYLGTLLAEITSARLQADLEAARIAQLYASHPLLQHMPVPRFRLPSVSLDLPVAVEKIDPPPPVQVLLATAQLKEIAPPWSLTRIHLTISEEGVEWTQTNPSDDASKTLVPE